MSKWCNAKFLQICSDEQTNSSTSWTAWENIRFWVNNSFNIYWAVKSRKESPLSLKCLISPFCAVNKGYYFKDCCDNGKTWCCADVKGSDVALASVHHFSALLRACSKHNHRRSNQDIRRRERLGLGLHTHPPPHTQHFTAITVHLNLKCRVIGMITLIPSSFHLYWGRGFSLASKRVKNLWFIQTSVMGHFLNDPTPLASEDTITLCSLSVKSETDPLFFHLTWC